MQQAVVCAIKLTLDQALEEELVEYLGLERYEHLREGRVPEQTPVGPMEGRCLLNMLQSLTYKFPS